MDSGRPQARIAGRVLDKIPFICCTHSTGVQDSNLHAGIVKLRENIMFKFEIMTQDLNRELVEKLIGEHFKGFSIIEQIGYYDGKREDSINIVIMAPACDKFLVEELAGKIRDLNSQDSVLVITYRAVYKLI